MMKLATIATLLSGAAAFAPAQVVSTMIAIMQMEE